MDFALEHSGCLKFVHLSQLYWILLEWSYSDWVLKLVHILAVSCMALFPELAEPLLSAAFFFSFVPSLGLCGLSCVFSNERTV